MTITLTTGAVGTGQTPADRQVLDMSDKIYLLEPNAAPLYVLVSKLNKRVAINPTFHWLEDELIPTWGHIVTAADHSHTVLTADSSEGLYLVAGDLIKFPSTGEVMLVTSLAAGTGSELLTVRRGFGTTACADLADSAYWFKIGTAFMEGSTASDLTTKGTIVAEKTNYLQIFRKSVEITRTMANTELYGGADRPYQRKKKGIELMKEMESTFFFGEPKTTSVTTHPTRATGGIDYFLSTNDTDAGGTLTESEFEGFLRKVFRYGSNSRYLFAAPLILSVISLWAQGKLQMFPKDKTYGVAISQYLSPHGSLNLVKDIALEYRDISYSTYYGGYAYAIELEDCVYRYLQNRDIQLETDIQAPGDDSYKDQYICEVGCEFHNEKKHGTLTGVTG
jgi:hypothetical protein